MISNKLTNLFSSSISLNNVGQKTFESLRRINCARIIDLIWHLPTNIIKRELNPNLSRVEAGSFVISTLRITEISHGKKSNNKRSLKIFTSNETGDLELVFFNYYPDYLLRSKTVNSLVTVSGKIEKFGDKLQMTHPTILYQDKKELDEIIYPLTYGLNNRLLVKIINDALCIVPNLEEWIEDETIIKYNWPSFDEALKKIHHPKNIEDISSNSNEKNRLAYDEFLANQLSLGLIRIYRNKVKGISYEFEGKLLDNLLSSLNFNFTVGQKEVLGEIINDQRSDFRMTRLLQGDVGSGKTIIALAACVNIIESGYQTAIMAPTDLLANQHYNYALQNLKNIGIKIELLTGKIKGKKREAILDDLNKGNINLIIGTHAIFQENVNFKNLGFIVIDEQHRFGVEQRLSLAQKSLNPDVLLMSATPIPRTLTLAVSGDMDISKLEDKPFGRIPIQTSIISKSKIKILLNSIAHNLGLGAKIYWICPIIENQQQDCEDNSKEIAAAVSRYNEFSILFPDNVGMIHGKMKPIEKDNTMLRFANSEIKILVATTVIEVGIDIKDANIIVIEQAEKFGLSQLHQLRGRVGRGDKQSYCILLYDSPLTKTSKSKLDIMKKTENGFIIAEEDLRIRGAGEILGTKQSGLIRFKIADIETQQFLFYKAVDDASNILLLDPELKSKRGLALRALLKIFEYDPETGYLSS